MTNAKQAALLNKYRATITTPDADAATLAAERALATAHFLEQSARAASADGDLATANALHAGAMALAALARRRAGRDDDETADLDRRAILASLEFMPLA